MKIVADNKIPYIKGVLEPYAHVEYISGTAIGREDVYDADVLLVRTRTRCDEALLSGSAVRLVATATIGTDHIDSVWCKAHGIECVSAPGCNAGGVLQWVAAVLADTVCRRGCLPSDLMLGVVGVGHVGSLVEHYARRWGFRVVCSDPPRELSEHLGPKDGFIPFDELAARADIITFHVPYTIGSQFPTHGLAGKDFFAALRNNALVLNASRGGVIDEEHLKKALCDGRCDAGIDTWIGEPVIDDRLLRLVTYATPHIAGYSVQGKANATAAIVRAVARRFGLPLEDWYPPQIAGVGRTDICWEQMCRQIGSYFDIAAQTAELKSSPERFEYFRENYNFREEFF